MLAFGFRAVRVGREALHLAVAQIVILLIVWAQHVLMPLLLLLVLLLHYG